MKENLITNYQEIKSNNNAISQETILIKEVKKMLIIKYINLFFSLSRLFIMFFSLTLLNIPFYRPQNLFFIFLFFYSVIILPIFTLINLITIITGILGRNFLIQKETNNILDCIRYVLCCSCCACTKNVGTLKCATFIFGIINLIKSFYFLYNYIIIIKNPNNADYNPYILRDIIIKLILFFVDTALLFSQSYFFYYYEYFLKRGKIYIEFYKRLIIKNRNKEADLVRNELPININNFLDGSEDGTEMSNI